MNLFLLTSAAALCLLVLCWLVAVRIMDRGHTALVRSNEELSRQSAELARLKVERDRGGEGRLRAILDAALDAVIGMDADDVITYWNPRAEATFGWRREEALGRRLRDLVIPVRYRESHSRGLARFLATGEGPVLGRRIELEGLRRDGTEFPVELSIAAVKEGETYSFSAFLADMTERRRLEAQLLHAQKMEAIGRLAGGVAHDFNNALGVILGHTELLMRHASEAQRGKLEQILKATQRASGLTSQLLLFSRRHVVDAKVLSLNALLSGLEKMLRRLIGEDIALTIVPGADLGEVKADPGQLEQVVMNLCLNARDAMKAGGRLRIETANAELDAGFAASHKPMAAGRYVMLAVSDTGSGIEKETQSKIFEPFFTTKEKGKDAGLGLAIVYGIVKQAGGYVWVYSEVGRGTTFKIYLPRIDQPAVAPAVEETPRPSKGWQTILLVEDEASLRGLARELLEEHGYRVIEATGPNEAIEIARRNPETIHLLVTDIVMPGMNGRALAETLVAARPALRVLYMSGYTDDVIAHSGVLAPGALLLEKPFTVLALIERVRLALRERDGQ
jgi:PAS domain S-box-containing protein